MCTLTQNTRGIWGRAYFTFFALHVRSKTSSRWTVYSLFHCLHCTLLPETNTIQGGMKILPYILFYYNTRRYFPCTYITLIMFFFNNRELNEKKTYVNFSFLYQWIKWRLHINHIQDLNMPISYIDTKCENKNCRSTEKVRFLMQCLPTSVHNYRKVCNCICTK